MSAAGEAYEAAVAEIERVQAAGETELSFYSGTFRSLERIPPEIARVKGLTALTLFGTRVADLAPLAEISTLQVLLINRSPVEDLTPLAHLSGLHRLGLGGTKVADLTPLSGLTALQLLFLNDTQVNDLAPLAGLTALQTLWLQESQVSDLAPLAGLRNLHSVSLNETRVTDLRPIQGMRAIDDPSAALDFADTPFAKATAETRRLAAIQDRQQRTRETLAFLKTLPPWPEPLPWAGPPQPEPAPEPPPEPSFPPTIPAPLQVVEIDGVLRPAVPGDGLQAADQALARHAWEALRDFLADLAELKPRLGNQMPQMARALTRFEAALGPTYEAASPVAMGVQGQRVIGLAVVSDQTLAEADAIELRELAAAIDLFLRRFPEWRAYRDAPGGLAPEVVADALPQIAEIAGALADRPEIDPAVPDSLTTQSEAVRDDPSDRIAARGLVDSVGNVLSVLGSALWRGLRAAGRVVAKGVVGLGKQVLDEGQKLVAKGIAAAGLDLFLNKARALRLLAQSMPDQFGWILTLLARLGL